MKTTTLLVKGIPEDLKKLFKVYCIEQDTDMSAEVMRLITRALEADTRQKKIK